MALDKSVGLFGNPIAFFKTLPQDAQYAITFVVGMCLLAFVVMFFINLFGSGAVAQAGAVSGNVGMRNAGTSGIMYGVGVVLMVIVAVALFVFLF